MIKIMFDFILNILQYIVMYFYFSGPLKYDSVISFWLTALAVLTETSTQKFNNKKIHSFGSELTDFRLSDSVAQHCHQDSAIISIKCCH